MTRRTWRDYGRALIGALRLTLQGQTLTARPGVYPPLAAWAAAGVQLVDAVFMAADAAGLDTAVRQQIRLRLDGRPISMQVILAAVRHNLAQEYPLLLREKLEHQLTAIYAFNLNDQYRVGALIELLNTYPAVVTALNALHNHLNTIPTKAQLEADLGSK